MGIRLERYVKTPQQISVMREGGKILATILDSLHTMILPDINVWDLEETFINLCETYKVIPSCKGYSPYYFEPFPTGLCLSINTQAVHCYPHKGLQLQSGDLVTVDTVIEYKGLKVDSAFAECVGVPDQQTTKLLATAKKALTNATAHVSGTSRIGDISNAMQKTVENAGFNVLRDYAGHGIGRDMHEPPEIACYGNPNTGPRLLPGMTICIEALVCEGKPEVLTTNDWETRMADNKKFLQFEHTVLVKEQGYEILTSL